MARLKYAFRQIDKSVSKLSFNLPNGISVEYPASDQGYYLASIVKSLFENTYFSRLISGIASRDIRKGLEVFLDFCKSAHLNETIIFNIKQFKGQYLIPNHIISRIILRGSMKYYIEQFSNVKNIFYCNVGDPSPDPFIRVNILSWLELNFKKTGPTRNIGYHKIATLIADLVLQGHSEDALKREIDFLIQNKYVVTESQSEKAYEPGDLMSIAPGGLTLIMLLNDINYLAACAEDQYYANENVAEGIYQRISEMTGYSLYSVETTVANSGDLINYLEKYKEEYLLRKSNLFANTNIQDFLSFDKQREILQKMIDKNETLYKQIQYPNGTVIEAEVVAVKDYGIFVEFGLDASGFLHISEFNFSDVGIADIENGDKFDVKVRRYSSEHHRYELEFAN